MRPIERQKAIMELISQDERVFVDDLTQRFATSAETIRRDLNALADAGQIRKFHGGASRLPSHDQENAFDTRLHENANEKQQIAACAAELFEDGTSLFIDTGTTTLVFARELARLKTNLTVITNSVVIANEVARYQHRVFLLGGEYQPDSSQSLGALTIQQVEAFSAQHVVSTIGALNTSGAADYSLEEAEMTRAMCNQAQTLTVLADHSKLGRRALFKVFPLNTIDRLVTDQQPAAELASALTQAGVELHLALDSQ